MISGFFAGSASPSSFAAADLKVMKGTAGSLAMDSTSAAVLPLTVMDPFLLLLVLHWRKVLLVLSIALAFGWARDAFAEPIVGRVSKRL